ncbi:MAG: hypothetical protein H0W88_12390 [Parachlamydiaceae bacterium]|nr:hypothetical protein [Parachlamydiaceae bacterium]
MSTPTNIKFFLGFIQNGEIKMHLNHSNLWKDATLFQKQELMTTHFQEKEYIGISIETPISTIILKDIENNLKEQMQHYFPKLEIDKHNVFLFSQLFLS